MNGSALKKGAFVFVGAVLMTIAMIFSGYCSDISDIAPITDITLEEHGIASADKLMITAHPDDEIVWGGGHLMDGGYFVVVITNGKNDVRRKEFERVIESSGNSGIILDYPDKILGLRSSWTEVYGDISGDIEKIMEYKDWKLIVTHNKKGEYGHIHHKMTHKIVRDIYDADFGSRDTKLYFFGDYYRKSEIGAAAEQMEKMDDERVAFKEELLKLYTSQERTIKKLSHMNSFENWTEYEK